MKRYIENSFEEDIAPTVAANYKSKSQVAQPVGIPTRTKVKLFIWDTPGNERFRSLTKLWIREAKVIVLVYSANNQESFEALENWIELLAENGIDP